MNTQAQLPASLVKLIKENEWKLGVTITDVTPEGCGPTISSAKATPTEGRCSDCGWVLNPMYSNSDCWVCDPLDETEAAGFGESYFEDGVLKND